jgi:hypothetical protein
VVTNDQGEYLVDTAFFELSNVPIVEVSGGLLPGQSLDIDYARYGAGEAQLAWLDETITIKTPNGNGREVTSQLMTGITSAINEKNWAIGHLKFLAGDAAEEAKISFPTFNDAAWLDQLPALNGPEISLLVNARVEADATALRQLVQQAVAHIADATNLSEINVACFHPAQPNPTHRIG